MKNIFFILLLAVITAVSCKKTASTDREICAEAFVRWGGDPAADGTGWHLYIPSDNIYAYKYPDNFPGDFKTDGLPVTVCYTQTGKDFPCFCMQPLPKMVHITSIRRR